MNIAFFSQFPILKIIWGISSTINLNQWIYKNKLCYRNVVSVQG